MEIKRKKEVEAQRKLEEAEKKAAVNTNRIVLQLL